MSIDFSKVTELSDQYGNIVEVTDEAGNVLWAVQNDLPAILEVKKITSDTYAGETTYTGEQFILLDIYPKTNGTVKVTYGGLTKTITDTSGAEEPNAQQVFFGTFNGVSDSVTTPASGTLTIEGDYYAFGCGSFAFSSKTSYVCGCVTAIESFGAVSLIPDKAFGTSGLYACDKLTTVEIPEGVKTIGPYAFGNCGALESVTIPSTVTGIGESAFYSTALTSIVIPSSVETIGAIAFSCNNLADFTILATTPPTAVLSAFETWLVFNSDNIPTITVPKGCGAAYKAAAGWSDYADYIEEAS